MPVEEASSLHVAIVGAGIGGLTCAIACRRANPPLQVTVFEKAPEIQSVGAGIHIPPNSCRELARFGLVDKLKRVGGYEVEDFTLRRYENGKILVEKPLKGRMMKEYGAEWIAIHRGDYQQTLLEEAIRLGSTVMTHAEVTSIEPSADGLQTLLLKDGQRIRADVVVGADGLWSIVREHVLQRPFTPDETGDLAYRGIFTRDQLKDFGNPRIDKLVEQTNIQVWLGENNHAVFYPLRDNTEFNLVLLCVDDMPAGARTQMGSADEMRAIFQGWDPILSDIISCVDTPLKWKLMHFKELDQWTRGTVTLLGDASHPTLPYQGQGAAMAVEDGAILGKLLAQFQNMGQRHSQKERNSQLRSLLRLFQDLRKDRTEVNVAGAMGTRHYYHLKDGEEQEKRDAELAGLAGQQWQGPCSFNWGDAAYQRDLLGFDGVADAQEKFEAWSKQFTRERL